MTLRADADFVRFACVGLGANAVNVVLYVLLYSFGVSAFLGSAAGYIAGLSISYHFGRTWVFGRMHHVTASNLKRFVFVYTCGGLLMSSIIELLVSLRVDYRASWLVGAAAATANNFFGSRLFIFDKGSDCGN